MGQVHHETWVGWPGPGNCRVRFRGLVGVSRASFTIGLVFGRGVNLLLNVVNRLGKRLEGVLNLLEVSVLVGWAG